MTKGEYILHSVDGELYHYGVKGMKWRNRKAATIADEIAYAKDKASEAAEYTKDQADSVTAKAKAAKAKYDLDSSVKSMKKSPSLSKAGSVVSNLISSAGATLISNIKDMKVKIKSNM
jgi:hypothetical protein